MKYDKGGARDFLHVLKEDAYRLRSFPVDYFTHIIDIGANIGAFSILAKCINPHAKILAVEPAKETHAMLADNTELYEIDRLQAALGDGKPVNFMERTPEMSVRNVFLKEGNTGYSVPTMSLAAVLREAGINEKSVYYLKIDCEGGERCLVDLRESDAIRNAACFAIELHYEGTQWEEWRELMKGFLLPYETYYKFLTEALKDTHVPVKPLKQTSWGVSEHLFVHKRHIKAYNFSFEQKALAGLAGRVYRKLGRILPDRLLRK